ncbi:MAG: maf [Nevskia sp.]|nr:maf [Nevskia sp.]
MSAPSTAISTQAPLLLASGSRYRAELLRRLQVPFEPYPADADETPLPGEAPDALAARLALVKARAVAQLRAGRWVLGSDQVCACRGSLLGKPGSRERAVQQLQLLSGNDAVFYTAVALLQDNAPAFTAMDQTRVRFRDLSRAEIERYVEAEPSFDCAGSFKSEGLGIALCASIDSSDPSGLIGLPLIATRALLAQAGLALP